jgi:phosphohistidine phosphatase SixA
MKTFVSVLLALLLFGLVSDVTYAQQKYRKLTVILLRHAEKEKSDDEDAPDPQLSPAGDRRALKLEKLLNKYHPDAVFSSQFIRTRSTIMPFARNRRMMIQIYNHRDLKEIAAVATAGNFKRIVIVGHNSTTPALTNILIGEDKYKALDESEYDKIFIVRLKKRKNKPTKVRDFKMITY